MDELKSSLGDFSIESDGCQMFRKAAAKLVPQLTDALSRFDNGQAGQRIAGDRKLSRFLAPDGPLKTVLSTLFEGNCRPVRAVFFNKSIEQNWALSWHQDRTICVKSRIETPGFGPFSNKGGLIHVSPPFDIIERMRTLRIHLDPVTECNAPLRVATGSHLLGFIAAAEARNIAAQHPLVICTADVGDIWAYATSVLHSSDKSRSRAHRRVLQVDYSADELPGGLEWLGV